VEIAATLAGQGQQWVAMEGIPAFFSLRANLSIRESYFKVMNSGVLFYKQIAKHHQARFHKGNNSKE